MSLCEFTDVLTALLFHHFILSLMLTGWNGCIESDSKARFKRRTLHVPNLMQMSENNRFFSFALDSSHVKFDV